MHQVSGEQGSGRPTLSTRRVPYRMEAGHLNIVGVAGLYARRELGA
jgi:hypothetical protein